MTMVWSPAGWSFWTPTDVADFLGPESEEKTTREHIRGRGPAGVRLRMTKVRLRVNQPQQHAQWAQIARLHACNSEVVLDALTTDCPSSCGGIEGAPVGR